MNSPARIQPPRLLLITDPSMSDLRSRVATALGVAAHGVGVLFRDKVSGDDELLEMGNALRRITAKHDVPLLVSARADIALAIGADGVHLPAHGISASDVRGLLEGALVGRSCHDRAELAKAEAEAIDYVTLSPIWAVPNKGEPLGPQALARLIADSGTPALALGDITPERAIECVGLGAHGVAVLRGVLGASDPASAMSSFCAFLDLVAAQSGP